MAKEYTRATTVLGSLPVAASVLYHQTFDHLVSVIIGSLVGDSTVELDPSISFSGPNSLLMKTRAVGAAADDSITISDLLPLPPSKQTLFTLRFSSPNMSPTKTLTFTFEFLDGTARFVAVLIYDQAAKTLSYVDEGGSPVVIASFSAVLVSNMFHFLAISIDFASNRWVAVQFNDLLVNLSGVPLQTSAVAASARAQFFIEGVTAGAATLALNIDELAIIDGRLI